MRLVGSILWPCDSFATPRPIRNTRGCSAHQHFPEQQLAGNIPRPCARLSRPLFRFQNTTRECCLRKSISLGSSKLVIFHGLALVFRYTSSVCNLWLHLFHSQNTRRGCLYNLQSNHLQSPDELQSNQSLAITSTRIKSSLAITRTITCNHQPP